MNFKPSDFFLGIVDFFAVFAPGVIGTYTGWLMFGRLVPLGISANFSNLEGWLVFIGTTYVVGHLLAAIAGSCFDPLYDRYYVPVKRVNPALLEKMQEDCHDLKKRRLGWRARRRLARSSDNLRDPLLECARYLKERELHILAVAVGVKQKHVGNVFDWALSVVRSANPVSANEVDRLLADSKLFRSLALVSALAFVGLVAKFALLPFLSHIKEGVHLVRAPDAIWGMVLAIILAPILLVRFAKLRWDATARVYEYYVITRTTAVPLTLEKAGVLE
jgi:hypothetical protein